MATVSSHAAAGDFDEGSNQLELLAFMGREFASTLDISSTLNRALDRITRYVGAEGGALFLLENGGKTLRCQSSVGATEITGLTLGADQGIVGRCVQTNTGAMVRDVQADPNFHSGFDKKTGYTTRSILCAPLSVKDERIGAIELINKRGGDGRFDHNDLHLLQVLSSSAALAILNARMAEALVEQERVRRELELAAEIQRSLLPKIEDADFPIAGVNVPARTVSGDFYDFFALEDGRICFNLGDVSGKGMNAALLMAKTASLYRCLGKTTREPGLLLSRVNNEICETATRGMFVTMVGGIYDPESGIVRLANAGHEPPLCHAVDGTFHSFPAEAPPLGVVPGVGAGTGFPETEIHLDGGTLYVFTDGVTEGYLEDGAELQVEGLKTLIREHCGLAVKERIDAFVTRIVKADTALRDDLTVLAIDDRKSHKKRKRHAGGRRAGRPKTERMVALRVASSPDRLRLLRSTVSSAAELAGCSEPVIRDIVIAVDEACQNIIRHAYKGSAAGEIILEIDREDQRLVILLKDFAPTIDVSKVKPRDLDDIRPGGLGTHFIRSVMDEVKFLTPPGGVGNVLKLVKKVE